MTPETEERLPCVIVGAGPAGLTAACELVRLGIPAVVLEQDPVVGGIARTVEHEGYRFDIGGHRFFTKVPWVQAWWEEVLADDFLVRPRLSRIFYEGRFFDYPLKPLNALRGLGPLEAVRIAASFGLARLRPAREEPDFERWVSNRFGRRLYEIFFKTYTEKVWGMPCSEIRSDWAAQRIRNLDLVTVVRNAFLGEQRHDGEVVTTLIEEFHYPRLGPGMMWERARKLAESGGVPTLTGMEVRRLHVRDGRVEAVTARDASGTLRRFEASHVLSSMPIRDLVERLDPPAPAEVREAAARLRYRDFLTVGLMLDCADPFPDNWIYVHSPEVKVGRIQNFKRWSPDMVPSPGRSSLGLEYFVQEGDELWSLPDEELVALARRECATLRLIRDDQVIGGTVIRMPKAYPVYDAAYREALDRVRLHLQEIPNLQLMGRNGQHRYNNQDHSMVTAAYAAQNVAGASHDVWNVNVEEDYHEEVARPREARVAAGERLVPVRLDAALSAEVLRRAFARYDAVALGGAVGLLAGVGLFLGTAVLLLVGNEPVGPNLALLGNYLPGFTVTWGGAVLGLIEAGAAGFSVGYLLAQLINAVVRLQERALLRRVERSEALRAPEEST